MADEFKAVGKKIREMLDKNKIDKIFDEVFSEGFFNYFHTTYGTNDMNINEQMHNDLDKKLNELKKRLIGGD